MKLMKLPGGGLIRPENFLEAGLQEGVVKVECLNGSTFKIKVSSEQKGLECLDLIEDSFKEATRP